MTPAWVQIDSQGYQFKTGPQFCCAVPITSPHLSSSCLEAHKAFTESLNSSRLAATVFTSCCEDRPQCSHDIVNFSCFCGFFNNIVLWERVISPQPSPQPRGPDQRATLSLVSILRLVRHGWPLSSPCTAFSQSLSVNSFR